jgi:hypothetical protein
MGYLYEACEGRFSLDKSMKNLPTYMCISNTNVAIKFSVESSSGMLKVQSFVSQIIQKLLGA